MSQFNFSSKVVYKRLLRFFYKTCTWITHFYILIWQSIKLLFIASQYKIELSHPNVFTIFSKLCYSRLKLKDWRLDLILPNFASVLYRSCIDIKTLKNYWSPLLWRFDSIRFDHACCSVYGAFFHVFSYIRFIIILTVRMVGFASGAPTPALNVRALYDIYSRLAKTTVAINTIYSRVRLIETSYRIMDRSDSH